MRTWMVRCGGRGRFYDEFRTHGFVAMSSGGVGDMSSIQSRDAMIAAVRTAFPGHSEQGVNVGAGQLLRFRQEFQKGDRVVTYDPGSRRYSCGVIAGDYKYDSKADDEGLANQRPVEWSHETLRDELSAETRASLGSSLTIFSISEKSSRELWREQRHDMQGNRETANDAAPLRFDAASVEQQAHEAIKDRLVALGWEQMQELVAGLLRAMGYKTELSPVGPDRGKDIIASPDGLGFRDPRIFVEVKHRPNERIGSAGIRSFLGGRHPGDKGLYVSTGGFSTDARYEAERASIPIMLMDFERLVESILEHYDEFDQETRQLLPLRAIYWPISI